MTVFLNQSKNYYYMFCSIIFLFSCTIFWNRRRKNILPLTFHNICIFLFYYSVLFVEKPSHIHLCFHCVCFGETFIYTKIFIRSPPQILSGEALLYAQPPIKRNAQFTGETHVSNGRNWLAGLVYRSSK